MPELRAFADLVSALVRLRQSLEEVPLWLEVEGAEPAREARRTMVNQLEDYVFPRLLQIDAPLLAVVGGSTGAGKSTLVNSLVGAKVSPSGVLRPTTKAPVLVHNPDDATWFEEDRILPDLPRAGAGEAAGVAGDAVRVVAVSGMPAGLALLDAPDVDSVDRANRDLATELLASADLWIFVTSAARYADQVPWNALADAARRSTAVAVVLDRTAPEHIAEVRSHLARMLTARGLRDSPLFNVPESDLDDGMLPSAAIAGIRGWLLELASNGAARSGIVERSLHGTLRSLVQNTHRVADAAAGQVAATDRIRDDVEAVYAEATAAAVSELETGDLLRGPVLARWHELVAGGEPERWADGRGVGLRDRLTSFVWSRTSSALRLEEAVVDSVSAALVDISSRAADLVEGRWPDVSPEGPGTPAPDAAARARATRDLRSRATEQATHWQATALSSVRTALAAVEPDDDRLSGVAVVLQVAALGRGGITGGHRHSLTAASGVEVTEQAFAMLARAIDVHASAMIERLVADLSARIVQVLASERETWLAEVERLGTRADHVERLRDAVRAVDDKRPSGDGS